jgi:glycosyltransferase involved in cell wall biosynthesis
MTRSVAFFASHAAGGIRELWADLAAGLAERGCEVRLAALYPYEPEAPPAPGTLGWTYMLPDRPAGLPAKLRMLGNLARWLRRHRPDTIVVAMPAANVLIAVLARLFSPGTAVLTSHHSPVETHSRALDALDGWTGRLGNVRAIIAVSQAVADSLAAKSASYRRKVHTIHNALPRAIGRTLATMAAARDGHPRGRTAIAAGRLAEQKNYPTLVRAARAMLDVRVEILGGGPDEAALKAQAAALGVGDRVHFLGQRDRASALAQLSRADVFVQVSRYEGHSLALLEAAALGLPLVVSDVASQREGVRARDGTSCGIIVPLEDDAALARAILELLDDPVEQRRWAERARRLAGEATFEALLTRYEALIAPPGIA